MRAAADLTGIPRVTEIRPQTKLHLGCGHVIKPGWINHDIVRLPGVDVVHDLSQFPWPFVDGQFEEVFMKDVLEHLPDLIQTMDELFRITKPGAKVYITVPYWNSLTAVGDPTHVRFFNEYSLTFFDPRTWQCRERPYYSRARFYTRRLGLQTTPFATLVSIPKITRDYTVYGRFWKRMLLALASVFCNVIDGLEFTLERAD